MDFDKSLKFTVTEDGGRSFTVVIEAGSALIGSGGHCDIRLGQEQAAVEQMFFDVQPGGLFAEVRANQPKVVVDGVPFQRGRVLEGRAFRIGRLEISAELAQPPGKAGKTKEGVRPGVLILAVLVFGFGIWSLAKHHGDAADDDYMDAPSLFAEQVTACPPTTSEGTDNAVDAWLREAEGRHERAPFSPQDGVEAVGLYRKAASCLRKLDRAPEAAELTGEADSLANRLEKDFHVHRVRLSRALTEGDSVAARHEVGLLRGYLIQRRTDFAAWLDLLDRKLGLQSKEE